MSLSTIMSEVLFSFIGNLSNGTWPKNNLIFPLTVLPEDSLLRQAEIYRRTNQQ